MDTGRETPAGCFGSRDAKVPSGGAWYAHSRGWPLSRTLICLQHSVKTSSNQSVVRVALWLTHSGIQRSRCCHQGTPPPSPMRGKGNRWWNAFKPSVDPPAFLRGPPIALIHDTRRLSRLPPVRSHNAGRTCNGLPLDGKVKAWVCQGRPGVLDKARINGLVA